MNSIKNLLYCFLPIILNLLIQLLSIYLFTSTNMLSTILCLITFLFWFKKYEASKHSKLAKSKLSICDFFFLVILSFGCQILITGILDYIYFYFPELFTNKFSNILPNKVSLLSTLIIMIILGPIVEELTFRGLTLSMFKENISYKYANLFQAILFAIYHHDFIQGIYTFFIGYLLGYIYLKTNNLRYSICIHMFLNFFSVFIVLIPMNNFFMLISGAIIITLFFAYFNKKSLSTKK
ncbi:MAG: CPBP family intramembrane metalloprotease [Clostridiaceae bacterium]|nr:CPBP family intramembrane metalloprotease [Clostridiaceae bacterium]